MESLVEQRGSPRVSVNIPAKLICAIDRFFLTQVVSLNENGFLCVCKKSIPLQTKVKVILLLPGGSADRTQSLPLTGEGLVVREHLREEEGETRYAVAVKFTEMVALEVDRLKIFMTEFYSFNA